MKKILSTLAILSLIICFVFLLSACSIPVIGDLFGSTCEAHVDANLDGKCDNCDTVIGVAHTKCADDNDDGICEVCNQAVSESERKHTYSSICDAECDTCGATRDTEHTYLNDCDSDCNNCGEAREITHKYKNKCDDDCDVCGQVRSVNHVYSGECDATCNICDEKRVVSYHIFDDKYDPECNACGLVRDVPKRDPDRYFTDGTFKYELNEDKKSYTLTSIISKSAATVTIPAVCNGLPVTAIGEAAFSYCTELVMITIPENIESIGHRAFSDCYKLSEINFNAVKMDDLSSDNYAFYNAGRDSEGIRVTIGKRVTKIPAYLFCSDYESDYVTSIVSVEFEMGSVCRRIANSAFYNCTALTAVYLSDIESWCEISFDNYFANPLYYAQNLYVERILVTEIEIGNKATSIGAYAFYDYDKLTDVIVPASVSYIGMNAFAECSNLASVIFAENAGVKVLNNAVFSNCEKLAKISIPVSVTDIGTNAFYGCNSITAITVPQGIMRIGSQAFYDCDNLLIYCEVSEQPNSWSVTWKEFDTVAFWECTGVTEEGIAWLDNGDMTVTVTGYLGEGTDVVIPAKIDYKDVTAIKERAFADCYHVTSIAVADSVITIGEAAFENCIALETLVLPFTGNNADATSFDSHLGYVFGYTVNDEYSIEHHYYDAVNNFYYTYNIPASLVSVTISDEVIADSAFRNCDSITEIVMTDSVIAIGNNAFFGCDGITSVVIPDSVAIIGNSAFEYCASLVSVKLGLNVTEISEEAFASCTSLVSITLNNRVRLIGDYAFCDCALLAEVNYTGSEDEWSVVNIGLQNDYFANARMNYDYVIE